MLEKRDETTTATQGYIMGALAIQQPIVRNAYFRVPQVTGSAEKWSCSQVGKAKPDTVPA